MYKQSKVSDSDGLSAGDLSDIGTPVAQQPRHPQSVPANIPAQIVPLKNIMVFAIVRVCWGVLHHDYMYSKDASRGISLSDHRKKLAIDTLEEYLVEIEMEAFLWEETWSPDTKALHAADKVKAFLEDTLKFVWECHVDDFVFPTAEDREEWRAQMKSLDHEIRSTWTSVRMLGQELKDMTDHKEALVTSIKSIVAL
ncbi:hypothetical protein CC86DRAFT_385321 [Ophiobolus disseminans]|uniref:Uncharacterized protein n=1 Tax=Ophiobolus disseminans TaxID=1469910 RepID=A0A6A6ZPV7_9PLEO|nr:hypothetical protein CC86DRAFT_385321 [Ophiobolus disseminans]